MLVVRGVVHRAGGELVLSPAEEFLGCLVYVRNVALTVQREHALGHALGESSEKVLGRTQLNRLGLGRGDVGHDRQRAGVIAARVGQRRV